MRISPLTNNRKNFRGELYIKNIHSHLFAEDFKEIFSLRNRITKEPYDITMQLDSFGRISTKISHENGNEVNIGRVKLPRSIGAVPEYIEKIMDLINISKVK